MTINSTLEKQVDINILNYLFAKSAPSILILAGLLFFSLCLYSENSEMYSLEDKRQRKVLRAIINISLLLGIAVIGRLWLLFNVPYTTLTLINYEELGNRHSTATLGLVHYQPYFSQFGGIVLALCYFTIFAILLCWVGGFYIAYNTVIFYLVIVFILVFIATSTVNLGVVFVCFWVVCVLTLCMAYLNEFIDNPEKIECLSSTLFNQFFNFLASIIVVPLLIYVLVIVEGSWLGISLESKVAVCCILNCIFWGFRFYISVIDDDIQPMYFICAGVVISLVLIAGGLLTVYDTVGTLDFTAVTFRSYSMPEGPIMFWSFFIGFGILIGLFPFYYGWGKIHNDSSLWVSLFLSGIFTPLVLYFIFLCKGLFSFYYWILTACSIIGPAMAMLGFEMAKQNDLKKIVAYALVHETLMLFGIFIAYEVEYLIYGMLLLALHVGISCCMWYVVWLIEKHTGTRDIRLLSGLGDKFPILHRIVGLLLGLFFGIPATLKFTIGWQILSTLATIKGLWGFVIFLVVFGPTFWVFMRAWSGILYGEPSELVNKLDTIELDIGYRMILGFISACVIIPCFILFWVYG